MTTTNQTNRSLKKYFYSGIGLAAHSKDIFQKSVDEFVKHGKASEAEGKKIISETVHNMEARYNEAIHKLGAYTSSEISRLKSRIESLEKQLATKNKRVSNSSKTGIRQRTRTSTRQIPVQGKK